jgi:hypothetical protein
MEVYSSPCMMACAKRCSLLPVCKYNKNKSVLYADPFRILRISLTKSRLFNINAVLCQSFSCVLLPAALHGFPPDNHLLLTGGKPTAVLIFTIAWEGSSVNGIFSFSKASS